MINKTELAAKIRQAKQNTPDISIRSLSRRFKVHHSVVTKALAGSEAPQKVETSEQTKDTWTITLPQTRIHTLEELIEYCQVDLAVWSVDRFTVNKWEMGAKNDDGKVIVTPLYQVKAFLKRKTGIDPKKEIEDLKAISKKDFKSPPRAVPNPTKGLMLELALFDLHAGKLAWSRETGGGNYDTKIAVETFWRAFHSLLQSTAHYKFESILYIVGQDLLNSDNVEGQTTAGTPQSNDGRFHKTFTTVRQMNVEAIEKLRQIAPVHVITMGGNHDRLSTWMVGDSLQMYYRNYKDVTIENSPLPRKYFQFGKNMLMICHGDKGKRADYPLTMSTEQPHMWGDTLFREAHTGHLHTSRLDEKHGVRVRILPALCPPDSWHSSNFYIGNLQSAEAFVWHREKGLLANYFYTEVD